MSYWWLYSQRSFQQCFQSVLCVTWSCWFSDQEYDPLCWCITITVIYTGGDREGAMLLTFGLTTRFGLIFINWSIWALPGAAYLLLSITRDCAMCIYLAHPILHKTNLLRRTWPSSTGKWTSPPSSPSSTSSPPSYRHSITITMPHSPSTSAFRSWPFL